jgi:hypothetical protein
MHYAHPLDPLLDRLHEMGACGCDRCKNPRMKVQQGVRCWAIYVWLGPTTGQVSAGEITLEETVDEMLKRLGAGVPENYDPEKLAESAKRKGK